jgi:hypothetical protein
MKDQLQTLLSKEMSRKEFLQHIGAALLMLFGVSGLINSLTQKTTQTSRVQSMGYGSSAYGGSEK